MKSFNKRKASKITFKNHRKHKLSSKEEEQKIVKNNPSLKPDDILK